jgi:2-phosphosulfolactate phosphatase
MRIIRTSCADGARGARGLVVVIDVFRAFSCEPLFFHFGAAKVIMEADPEKAMALKLVNPELVLVGEINGVPLETADFGNSPSEIIKAGGRAFRAKTIVHRTTAGVTGAASALETAQEILLGSFVLARAAARYIKEKGPDLVTLVAMGERAEHPSPEDERCADYLTHLLTGDPYDPVEAFRAIVFEPTTQKFIQGMKPYLPREDPVFCLQRDLFDMVLTVRKEEDELVVKRIGLPHPDQPRGGSGRRDCEGGQFFYGAGV